MAEESQILKIRKKLAVMGISVWDLREAVTSKGASLLGTVLGNPAGGAIGGLLARAVGAYSDDPGDILAAMNANPRAD